MSALDSLNKKRNILFLLCIFLVFLIFSNSNWNSNSNLESTSAVSIILPGFIVDIVENASVLISYIILVILLIMIVTYYSNLIDKSRLRIILKIVILIFLFLGALTLLSTIQYDFAFDPDSSPRAGSGNPPLGGENTSEETIHTNPSDSTTIDSNFNDGDSVQNIVTFGSFIINFVQILIPVMIVIIVLFFLSIMRLRDDYDRDVEIAGENRYRRKPYFGPKHEIRSKILELYIEISDYLESKGVDPDFSLTPREFESDTRVKFEKIKDLFDKITEIYEVARFSDFKTLDQQMLNEMHEYTNLIRKEFKIGETETLE